MGKLLSIIACILFQAVTLSGVSMAEPIEAGSDLCLEVLLRDGTLGELPADVEKHENVLRRIKYFPENTGSADAFYEITVYVCDPGEAEDLTLGDGAQGYVAEDLLNNIEAMDSAIARVRKFPFQHARPYDQPWGTVKPAPRPVLENNAILVK